MRISKEDIERIKREVCIVSLIESYGVKFKKAGKDLIGHCPFHNDTTPSLVVTPSKNLWRCMGACQIGGSNIDWVMKRDGAAFFHAAEIVMKMNGNGNGSRAIAKTALKSLPAEKTEDRQKLLNQTIDYYHETLKKSPEALAFLEKRGIKNTAAIETFKLGYANRTLGRHISKNSQSELRQGLKEIGIFNKKFGYEHFNGCFTVPIMDEHGDVQEIYGRKIIHSPKPNALNHLYLSGPHKGVWNIKALAESNEIILCESLIDALTFWRAGFRNVTASYGADGFTEDHIKAFRQYKTERVLIAYDRDQAGEKGAISVTEKLRSIGINCHRILFPKNMDANEYACVAKPAEKSLMVLIEAALQQKSEVRRQEPGVRRKTTGSRYPAARNKNLR